MANLYTLPNRNGNPVPIKKVRVFQPTVTNPIKIKKHRDVSHKKPKEYKKNYHVVNDGNYCMAIYEGKNDKGKLLRDFKVVNNLEAGEFFKYSVQKELKEQRLNKINGLVSEKITSRNTELRLKAILKTGTLVIFWKENPLEIWSLQTDEIKKLLYKVIKLNKDGRVTFKFHQEARNDEMLKSDYERTFGIKPPKSLTNGESSINFITPSPKLLLSPMNFNMLVENVDFRLSCLGKIERI